MAAKRRGASPHIRPSAPQARTPYTHNRRQSRQHAPVAVRRCERGSQGRRAGAKGGGGALGQVPPLCATRLASLSSARGGKNTAGGIEEFRASLDCKSGSRSQDRDRMHRATWMQSPSDSSIWLGTGEVYAGRWIRSAASPAAGDGEVSDKHKMARARPPATTPASDRS